MNVFTLTPAQLKALLSVAAKNDVRFYLNGVHCGTHNNHLRIEVTDGNHLLRVDLPDVPFDKDIIINRSDIERAAKMSKRNAHVTFECGEDIDITVDGVRCSRVNAVFPPIDRVIPCKTAVEVEPYAFNVDYLVHVRDALAAFDHAKSTGLYPLSVWYYDAKRIYVEPSKGSSLTACAVIMGLGNTRHSCGDRRVR